MFTEVLVNAVEYKIGQKVKGSKDRRKVISLSCPKETPGCVAVLFDDSTWIDYIGYPFIASGNLATTPPEE